MSGETGLRICIIKKWPDFIGYGFNLHAQKGKPGQFIGHVDADSPALHSGLNANDRLVEVNDVNVTNETHQQVVVRIKENASFVKLMVVDPETEKEYTSQNIVLHHEMEGVKHIECPTIRPTHHNPDESPIEMETNYSEPADSNVQETGLGHEAVIHHTEEAYVTENAGQSEEDSSQQACHEEYKVTEYDNVVESAPNIEQEAYLVTSSNHNVEEEKEDLSPANEGLYDESAPLEEHFEASVVLSAESPDDNSVEDTEEVQHKDSVDSDAAPVAQSPEPVVMEASNGSATVVEAAPLSATAVEAAPLPAPSEAPAEPKIDLNMTAAEMRARLGGNKRRVVMDTSGTFKDKTTLFQQL